MRLFKVRCYFCKKEIQRGLGRLNEAKKFGWRSYCSIKCQSQHRNKQKLLICGNSACKKTFRRSTNDIHSEFCFCSHSCAAIVNNHKRTQNYLPSYCENQVCRNEIAHGNRFCSSACHARAIKIPADEYKKQIIQKIKIFYNQNGRIPLKKEKMGIYVTARDLFGSWNHAIQAAGFNPNPIIFSKKYYANDGHKCDSLSEKIIDDWLTSRKISHERSAHYPNTKYTADFKIGNVLIEFFGLRGQLKSYDKYIQKKLAIIKDNNLKLISLFPEDIFPESRLGLKLSGIIKTKLA